MDNITLVGQHGKVVCERCEIAESSLKRVRGLLGRRELVHGDGLLIRPTWSIHTWFMRFPIDVVFLDRDLTVLGVREHLRPWKAAVHRGAHAALELPAGAARRVGLAVGDRLAWGSLVPAA
jgi:uncharacterized membrane protein (UPF0127 family)